jgi:hypothetical protein
VVTSPSVTIFLRRRSFEEKADIEWFLFEFLLDIELEPGRLITDLFSRRGGGGLMYLCST